METFQSDESYRSIVLQGSRPVEGSDFVSNKISSSDFTAISIIKDALLMQFLKLSNLWFLFVSVLEIVYHREGWNTLLLFGLILLSNALRVAYWKNSLYKNDKKSNKSIISVWNGVGFVEKLWENLLVGEIILLKENDIIPADILILAVGNQEYKCYVDTFEVLGERDLRVKKPIKSTQDIINSTDIKHASQFLKRLNETVKISEPRKNFLKFNAKINIRSPKPELISYENYILRGETLVNTPWIFAMAAYTGAETKIYMNSKFETKVSKLDKTLNLIVYWLLLLVITLTGIQVIIGLLLGNAFYNNQVDLVFNSILIVHRMIPSSLFLCVELSRIFQAWIIHKKYKGINFLKSSVNEDLGQVEYILIDKTGSLTKNELALKVCVIGEELYKIESLDDEDNEDGSNSSFKFLAPNQLERSDSNVGLQTARQLKYLIAHDEICNEKTKNFMLCMALCNNAFPVSDIEFTAILEDDRILAKCAQNLGVNMIFRTQNNAVVDINGAPITYKILGVLPFARKQKKSLIVISFPGKEGSILFAKGEKEEMLDLFDGGEESKHLISKIVESKDLSSLRTFIFGYKILSQAMTDQFILDITNANLSPINKVGRIESVFEKIQKNLNYLGIVGLDDTVSENSKQSVKLLSDFGIKFWVLSGDSEESTLKAGLKSALLEENGRIVKLNNLASEQACMEEMLENIKSCIFQEDYSISIPENPKLLISMDSMIQKPMEIRTEDLHHQSSEFQIIKKISDISYFKFKKPRRDTNSLRRKILPLISEPDLNTSMLFKKSYNHNSVDFTLSVDSISLESAIKTKESRQCFVALLFAANAVFFHSILPNQKRKIVKLLKNNFDFKPTVLAVGDGTDDIGMLQEAHIGVSLKRSGFHDAENASDIMIDNLSCLADLIIYEGHNCYNRMWKMAILCFYGNLLLVSVDFFYNVIFGFSANPLIPDELEVIFDLLVMVIPMVCFGIFENMANIKDILEFPNYYFEHIFSVSAMAKGIIFSVLWGFIQGLVIILIMFTSIGEIVNENGFTSNFDLSGFEIYIIIYVLIGITSIWASSKLSLIQIGSQVFVLVFSSVIILLLTYNQLSNDQLIGISEMLGDVSLSWICMIFVPIYMFLITFSVISIYESFKYKKSPKITVLRPNNKFSKDIRLEKYRNCIGEIYNESSDWDKKMNQYTFDINKCKLKFISEYREQDYQKYATEANLQFYKYFMILKLVAIIGVTIYRIIQEIDDLYTLNSFWIFLPDLLWSILIYTEFWKKWLKTIVIINFLTYNTIILMKNIFIPSIPILVIVHFFIGFSQFWYEMIICGLIFSFSGCSATIFYFSRVLNEEHDEVVIGSLEYMITYIGIALTSALIGYTIDKSKRNEYIVSNKVHIEVNKLTSILNLLLPSHVSSRVKNGERSFAKDQGIVSVIFCDMCNFDSIVASYSPQELASFLDDLFSKFDKLCEQSGVSKIETVGKTYMACAGLSIFESEIDPNLTCVSHARRAIEFALLVVKTIKTMKLKNGEELTFKIGINSGKVTAGVVGNHKPQFSLIGDTVNTSSRMCSTCTEINGIQISMDTYELLEEAERNGLEFSAKTIYAKGKGDMDTFIVSLNSRESIKSAEESRKNFQLSLDVPNVSTVSPNANSRHSSVSSQGQTESQNRSSLMYDLDIYETKELFKKTSTGIIEKPSFFSLKCQESQKERNFRLEIMKNKLPFYYTALSIAVLGFFFSIIPIAIKSIAKCDESNIKGIVALSSDIILFAFMIYLLRKYHHKRCFAWVLEFAYVLALVMSLIGTYSKGEIYTNLEVIYIMHWILLMTHCSDLFFHWNFIICLISVSPCVVMLYIEMNSFDRIFILVIITFIAVLYFTLFHREKTMRKSHLLITAGKKEIEKTEQLLKNMMPPHIYQNLRNENNAAEVIKDVTLIYADIVGFTAWSSTNSTADIVKRLSDLFTSFDKKCEKFHVYKVHTIGDCYVAMGYKDNDRNPQQECINMVNFAKSMIEIIEKVNRKYRSQLNMRIGIHTGDIIGAISGTNIVRYDVYGSDVLIANKMESNGEAGKICVSEVTKNLIESSNPELYHFSFSKEISIPSVNRTIKSYMLTDFSSDEESP
ncbi:unnamed protein product [Blepharisma stoltei]|uniref:Guanylate cyclase domain-containing protein n=1 Tax=Blepharisma stoltei TaxID=1481888 RepID=A0AAU9JTK0_9CILI|nr:unnamed protein product [Blepharisma stoltei]